MPLNRVFQIGVRGFPLTGGDGKCCNLYGDENLGRSGFDHSNLFKGQNQHAVNIERWLKSKLP